MKTIFMKMLMALAIMASTICQMSAQTTDLGTYSDSFHIRHDYDSGEAMTFTLTSPMHLTLHTYSPEQPLRPYDENQVPAVTGQMSVLTLRNAATGDTLAVKSGSRERRFVFDPYQACLVLPELPAGTYDVTVDGDGTTLLTVEGFLTDPPHTLDGREAGQPVEVGTFSSEFAYSHIRDTSGDGYWAGSGSPSKDVFYRFTITEPMYVVVTHWGTETMSEYMSSRLYVIACDPESGILLYPALAEVHDMYCEDNLMGEDNLTSLLVCPDMIPEIEENDPLDASWHGMLRPGTYFVMSEGPYHSTNFSQTFDGPIRTNIRGFIYPTEEVRKDIHAGSSENGDLEFSDSKFFGMAADDALVYRFVLDTIANLSIVASSDSLVLEREDSVIYSHAGTVDETFEQAEAGEYTVVLTSEANRMVSIQIASEKYIPPYVPETLDGRYNFVRTLRPFSSGHSDPVRIDLGNSRQTIDYYDGLGRPVQTVRRRESPTGEDLATYVRYEYGRPVQEWSETPAGQGSSLIPYSSIVVSASYAYSDANAFSLTEYEESPLSRTISVTGPGEAWHDAGKGVTYDYLVNDTAGVLRCLHFVPTSDHEDAEAPVLDGIYPAGTLTVTKTVSEDGIASYSFTDKAGQTILSRIADGEDFVDTYYVYDVRRMLRAVITPAAVDVINSTGALSDHVFEEFCYGYGYDDRGRCVEASKPGCGVTITVYSQNNYPLFVQTPELASKGKWRFDIPDIFGRSALTGLCSGTLGSLKEIAAADIVASFGEGPASSGFWQTSVALESQELHQASFYDGYYFLELFGERGSALEYSAGEVTASRRDAAGAGLTCKGLKTGTLTAVTDGPASSPAVLSALYYDIYGNVIQTRSENILGGISSISAEIDFQGNVLVESHVMADDSASVLTRIHEYDRAGRLMQTVTDLDGVEVVTRNTYNPVGRLEMTVVTSGEVSDTTLRSYNVRGWHTEIQNNRWSSVMRYQNPEFDESNASFTGNISEWEWTRGNSTDTYSLEYDALSRIVDSRLFRNGNPVDALSESDISYDSNGNLLSLTRTGESGSTINDLAYTYDGNRLTSLSDGDVQSQNYTYDADGNMTFDGRTGMSLTWNDLGLVEKVRLNDTDLVNYSYLADGTKVSALDGDGDGLLYLGSLIYRKTGSNISLESAGFAGGRFVARETSPGVSAMVPMIHVTDHLGSVRAVVDGISGAVVEANDYYPFGSRWNTTVSLIDQTNRFRYNSKEEQFNFGTPYIDYGARQYDPLLGRWFAQDPLSEKYYSISPYAFCAGNPVKYLDPDGEDPTLPARMAIGAAIGGAVSGTAAIIKGKSFTEVIAATAGGAVDGAIGAIGGKIATKLVSGFFGGGAGNWVEQKLNVFFGKQEEIDRSDIAVSAVLGASLNGVSEAIEQKGKSLIKEVINSDATQKALEKEVKQSVKSTGRKTTPSSVKKAVDNKTKEMTEAADKTLETSLQALGYSFGFYNDVLTDE